MSKEKEITKDEVKEKKEQALENKCPACNASISFNPKAGKWKCDYCGSEFSLIIMMAILVTNVKVVVQK